MEGNLIPPAWNSIAALGREWLEKGPPALEAIAWKMYGSISHPTPKAFLFDSPIAALHAAHHLHAAIGGKGIIEQLKSALVSQIGIQDLASFSRIGSQIMDGFRIGAPPFESSRRYAPEALCPLPWSPSTRTLESFTDRMGEILRELKGEDFFQDSLRAGFFKEAQAEAYNWFWQIGASRRWLWPYERFLIASAPPTKLRLEGAGRLHAETGPAVEFADGTEIFAISGVPVERRIIMEPETITIDEIFSQNNGEIRRVMIMRMGAGKYLKESGAKLLDMDSLTLVGSAPRALMEDKMGQKWLVGTDGSTARVYTMPVPEHVRTCREAHEAISGFSERNMIAEA